MFERVGVRVGNLELGFFNTVCSCGSHPEVSGAPRVLLFPQTLLAQRTDLVYSWVEDVMED